MDKLTLTLTQAAEAMNVSEPTMRYIVQQAEFPAFRVGKRWVIPVDTFNEWLNARASERAQI